MVCSILTPISMLSISEIASELTYKLELLLEVQRHDALSFPISSLEASRTLSELLV